MYLFLLGVLLGAVGICYLFNKPSIDLSNIAYLSSEIERHEFLACYFRKMLQSANERANLASSANSDSSNRLDSSDNGKKENNIQNKNSKSNVEDAADESIMRILIEKKRR